MRIINSVIKKIIGILIRLFPADFFLLGSTKISAFAGRLVFLRDWAFRINNSVPQFFKHYINLSMWRFEPNRWSFTARGVYAREKMVNDCKVLDLCCGDGTHSYLFFSDIAGHIDAIDIDASALSYALKYNRHSKINYHRVDIIDEPFPSVEYDVIVWNAGICYFSMEHILKILKKIVKAGKVTMVLSGMLPSANGHVDHKTEFADAATIEKLLLRFFSLVSIREVVDGADNKAVTFYFQASNPLPETY